MIVAGMFLYFPAFSHAQKAKAKKKPNQTTKTSTPKVSSVGNKPTEAEWQKITSEEGQFSILFPTKPQYIKQDVPNFTQYLYISSEDSENILYVIMAQTPDSGDNVPENVVLQIMQQNIPATNFLELKNISTSDINGWQWKGSPNNLPKGWIQYGKTIRDKRTRQLYTLSFAANGLDREKKFSKNADKFFDSFRMF